MGQISAKLNRFFPPKDLVYFWITTRLHLKDLEFFRLEIEIHVKGQLVSRQKT